MEDTYMSDTSSSSSSSSDSEEEDLDEFLDYMAMNLLLEFENSFRAKVTKRTSGLTGQEYVTELLNDHGGRCFDVLRMDREVFINLCRILRECQLLEDTHAISIEESVAMFLFIVGHNIRHAVVAERFQHSGETVSRHFKLVLRAICRLGKNLIRPPQSSDVPSHILHNFKYYPWFQKCIGAIDGTHVSAFAPASKQTPYRGRKSIVTQNVMCACSFDMIFTFVYAGWEGTANDSRVFLDALTRAVARFHVPTDRKYYVVDSGYPCTKGFLPPHRGQRYHLQEYRGSNRQPRGAKELFNYPHSSLRNVIERCFGVLKARFPILKFMSSYKLTRQRLIVTACCTIHNFIRQNALDDTFFMEFGEEDVNVRNGGNGNSSGYGILNRLNLSDDGAAQMSAYRNHITNTMWASFAGNDR